MQHPAASYTWPSDHETLTRLLNGEGTIAATYGHNSLRLHSSGYRSSSIHDPWRLCSAGDKVGQPCCGDRTRSLVSVLDMIVRLDYVACSQFTKDHS
ncbi:hypothetical protein CERSUDRAFT_114882 [Gelatoporia subvermispora B]|uniref:Uncharacterized protein n=1 Tax=Ceriporiopsis subvermispora (strain B) TaxID=914234 RepID=M2PL22_CERS8|nr:hypothetical protein CERSUDRAFT_114882 [Gelatoporia subvermispora B]